MPDTIVFIAAQTDRDEISLPVRGILAALAPTHEAHVATKAVDEVTAADVERCRALGLCDHSLCGMSTVWPA